MKSILVVLLIPGICYCGEQPVSKAPDYREYLQETAPLMCKKLLYCFEGFTRALSPDLKKNVTTEACQKSALYNLDHKVKRLNLEMQILSRECDEALLKAPCNEFGLTAYWNFSCIRLRAHIDEMIFASKSAR